NGDVAMRRHMPRMVDEVAKPQNAVIGHAVEEMGELRARQEEALEPHLLREPRIKRAEPARHDSERLALQHGAELTPRLLYPVAACLRHRPLPDYRHGRCGAV